MNPELLDLAATMFGEEATGNIKNLEMIGSSILNRVESGRAEEFGATIPEVTQKGYYAKSQMNDPYKWAVEGNFPDKDSEKYFKKALQIASGLMSGKIERRKGQFYFTDDEMKKQKDAGFDFKQVEALDKIGKYNVLQYKTGEGKKVVFKDDEALSSPKGLKKAINKSNFKTEFAKARRAGLKTFKFKDKEYTTDLK